MPCYTTVRTQIRDLHLHLFRSRLPPFAIVVGPQACGTSGARPELGHGGDHLMMILSELRLPPPRGIAETSPPPPPDLPGPRGCLGQLGEAGARARGRS